MSTVDHWWNRTAWMSISVHDSQAILFHSVSFHFLDFFKSWNDRKQTSTWKNSMNDLYSQVRFNSSTLFTMMQHYHLRQIVGIWNPSGLWGSERAPLGYLPPKAGVRSQQWGMLRKMMGKVVSQQPSNCQRQAVLKQKIESVLTRLFTRVTAWTRTAPNCPLMKRTKHCRNRQEPQDPWNIQMWHWWFETKPSLQLAWNLDAGGTPEPIQTEEPSSWGNTASQPSPTGELGDSGAMAGL